MCGRYVFIPTDNFYDRFKIENQLNSLPVNYNVSPGQNMPVVTKSSPNKVSLMRWGLIPTWADNKNVGYRMINARSETVHRKVSFQWAFKRQRCLVPASGFYEWKKEQDRKIPHYFYANGYVAFAGIYEVNSKVAAKPIESYSILTTQANEVVEGIHDRMPVILHQDDENMWLDSATSKDTLLSMLEPYNGAMQEHEVSTKVNKTTNNSRDLILPINSQ